MNANATEKALSTIVAAGVVTQSLMIHHNATQEILLRAARLGDSLANRVLANRPAISAEIRELLLSSADVAVVATMIDRPDTTKATLASIAHARREQDIRLSIARHPNTPPEILRDLVATLPESLVGWLRDNFYVALASNPSTPPDLIEMIFASTEDSRARAAVARNPNTPPSILANLLDDYPIAVADNPCVPPALLERLVAKSPYSLDIVVGNPVCPRHLVDRALASEDSRARQRAAANPSLSVAELERLAASQDEYLRAGVAACLASPRELLTRLSDDPSPRVWLALAGNPRAPTSVFEDLALRSLGALHNATLREQLRTVLANNRSVPPSVLRSLAGV